MRSRRRRGGFRDRGLGDRITLFSRYGIPLNGGHMFKLTARACIVAIVLWSNSIDLAYAHTISSNWTPDAKSGLPVLFRVVCSPVISSGNLQEYDAYFQNGGSQPFSFQVQVTPPGQGALPYAWQSVPTLAPGQQYGGALQGYAWTFSNLPCTSANIDSLNVFIQPNPQIVGANDTT